MYIFDQCPPRITFVEHMGWSMVLNLVVYLGYMAVFTFYFSVNFIVLFYYYYFRGLNRHMVCVCVCVSFSSLNRKLL